MFLLTIAGVSDLCNYTQTQLFHIGQNITMDFNKISKKITNAFGSVWAFSAAIILVIGWILGGILIYGFGEVSQLFINSITTIVTFLAVFSIQNAQNRESKITQLKFNELLRSKLHADNTMMDMEDMSDQELEEMCQYYSALANSCKKKSCN